MENACKIHNIYKKYTESQKKSSNENPRKHLYTQFDSHKCDSTNLTHDTNKRVPQFL